MVTVEQLVFTYPLLFSKNKYLRRSKKGKLHYVSKKQARKKKVKLLIAGAATSIGTGMLYLHATRKVGVNTNTKPLVTTSPKKVKVSNVKTSSPVVKVKKIPPFDPNSNIIPDPW